MVSVEEFSTLLDVLYSAALDPGKWEEFLVGLSRVTDSRLSIFLTADVRVGMVCQAQGGMGRWKGLDIDRYNERFAQNDPLREPCLRDPRPRIAHSEELLPGKGLLDSEMYRELLAPHDYRYGTFALCTVTLRRMEMISMWRGAAQGPMPPDRVRLLEVLFPHIRRALEIRQMMGVTGRQVAAAETAADASPTPTFLLSRRGRLVHANAAATALVEGQGSLVVHRGKLAPAEETARGAFRELLQKAGGRSFPAVEVHALPLPQRDGGLPMQLIANPLPASLAARTGADVLLLATDPGTPTARFPESVLRSLYGLTEAEADIANGLLMGFSLQEVARVRGVATGTVRAQMKTILAKTGTARQSDLVRLLMSLPPMRLGG